MGKAGRIACIFTPMALTIASFVCLILIEISGWQSSSALAKFYFFQANFTDINVAGASTLANSTELTAALTAAKQEGLLAEIYQIHLWNYCTSKSADAASIDYCSPKQNGFVFDPVDVWQLNASSTSSAASATSSSSGVVASAVNTLKNNTEALEDKLLGSAGKDALDAYRTVAKWMFIAYEVSFWTTLATIVFGILAIFSRWGSFLTWICSVVSSIFTIAAVLTSTILFGVLVGALEGVLHPYGVSLRLGTSALILTWLAVAFTWAATLFWLFSVCCCSGRSNPHHKSNKGGLWNAGATDDEKGNYGYGRRSGWGRRGVRAEKTGATSLGGYQRVTSPFLGYGDSSRQHDQVPLTSYPQPTGNLAPGYEPYRHRS